MREQRQQHHSRWFNVLAVPLRAEQPGARQGTGAAARKRTCTRHSLLNTSLPQTAKGKPHHPLLQVTSCGTEQEPGTLPLSEPDALLASGLLCKLRAYIVSVTLTTASCLRIEYTVK